MTAERIVFVAPFGLRPKGTTIARVLPVARVLSAQGAQVRVVVPPWDDPTLAGQAQHENGLEVIHTAVGTGILRPLKMMRHLGRLVDEFHPDVVHVFKPIGYSGLLGWWRARTSHQEEDALLVLDADDLEGPRGWGSRRSLGFLGWLRGWQELQTVRAVPRLTVASHWLEHFVENLGVRTGSVRWMPQGWSRTEPAATSAVLARADPGGGARLLWYTRFTEARSDRAARLFGPLLRAEPGRRLIVFGDELAPGARARAQAAFASAQVGSQVDWLGYQAGGLPGLLRERPVDLALYPMEDDLANWARCPTKLVELMAAGVPVIAEMVGEAHSYLAGFEGECLVVAGDPDAFTNAAAAVLDDEARRVNLSQRLQRAADAFEWTALAGGLLDWYEQLRLEA